MRSFSGPGRGPAALALLLAYVVPACEAAPVVVDGDAGPAADTAGGCGADRACDDGVFCNGRERCAAGADGGAGTCVAGASPCAPEQTCDEAAARCVTVCPVAPDADGDGVDAVTCGGADCDDADPMRAPGRLEICDGAHDEDCDPTTRGGLDADGDGVESAACCNGASCGGDCDDAASAVRPGAAEICDGIDQDCDGSLDEGVERFFFPDADADGWGDGAAIPVRGCGPPAGHVENTLDCNDLDARAGPGRTEVCDALDDDCDGTVDEALATSSACAATFGSPPNTRYSCAAGTCVIDPAADCRAGFWDCNAEPSDGCETDLGRDAANCGVCGGGCGVGGACTAGVCDAIVSIGAGGQSTCAVRASGLVACWGDNTYGQLGDGTTTDRGTPALVRGLFGMSEVDVSAFDVTPQWAPFACARGGASVYCWGSNEHLVLGSSAAGIAVTPERVRSIPADPSGTSPGELRANLSVGSWHVLQTQYYAMTAFETGGYAVWGWGWNLAGDLGIYCAGDCAPGSVFGTFRTDPVRAVAAGMQHTCIALVRAGTPRVACMGQNSYFTLGTANTSATAFEAAGADLDFVELDAGRDFTCGRRAGGRVSCWGRNDEGQLGDGSVLQRASPVDVGLSGVVSVDVGVSHACAALSTGAVLCWGEGTDGRLGDGTGASRSTPTPVADISDAVAVSAGSRHSCAIHRTGRVSCWGSNRYGQLGTGAIGGSSPVPVPVAGL